MSPDRDVPMSQTVIDVAEELVREGGLKALTIRAVADRAGLSPMTVYRYVDSKDAMLDKLLLRVLSRVEIPASFSADWRERIVLVMGAWRALLVDHSEIVPLLAERPIPLGSEGLARLQEAVLSNLFEGGMEQSEAVRAFWQIFSVTLGGVMVDLPRRGLRDEDLVKYGTALSEVAAERRFTHVATLGPQLASMSGRGSFDDLLRTLLRGMSKSA